MVELGKHVAAKKKKKKKKMAEMLKLSRYVRDIF